MVSITCPHGHGETDRSRCLDRAVCLLPPLTCLLCPIPMVLIAEGGRDNINRKVFRRLDSLISSPWTPPPAVLREIRISRLPGTIARGRSLAMAMGSYLSRSPYAERIPLRGLLSIHNAIPRAIDVQTVEDLARVCRRQGLSVSWQHGRAFLVVSDHVRAFVRAYVKAAA